MNNSIRPPVGFIVEGTGEWASYPSIVTSICGCSGFKIPRVNAEGCGNITGHLSEHLDDMASVDAPMAMMVTVDLRDVLRNGSFSDCITLKKHLHTLCEQWMATRRLDPRFAGRLPAEIVVVIQVQCFESWLLADSESLVVAGYLKRDAIGVPLTEVDGTVLNPSAYIDDNGTEFFRPKAPACVKSVCSNISTIEMERNSRSFRKFAKEVRRLVVIWQTNNGWGS